MSREFTEKIRKYKKDLITFTIGIGDSPIKAEEAMFAAKQDKQDKLYNIQVNPQSGSDSPDIDARVEAILELKKIISDSHLPTYEIERQTANIDTLLTDKQTGLSNSLGVSAKVQESKATHYCYLIFDGNNMHALNEKLGYQEVDKSLAASGQALSDAEKLVMDNLRLYDRRTEDSANTVHRRKQEEHDHFYRIDHPIISGRKHDTGDEFILMIPSDRCTPQMAYKVARRILKRIYQSQMNRLEDTLQTEKI